MIGVPAYTQDVCITGLVEWMKTEIPTHAAQIESVFEKDRVKHPPNHLDCSADNALYLTFETLKKIFPEGGLPVEETAPTVEEAAPTVAEATPTETEVDESFGLESYGRSRSRTRSGSRSRSRSGRVPGRGDRVLDRLPVTLTLPEM